MKIPFTLDAWLEDKSQKVETRDGRLVHNIWRVKEPHYTNNRRAEVCALIDGEEDALVFFEGGRYLPTTQDTDSPFDLFIVTPEPELSEFEERIFKLLRQYKECDIPLTPENIKAEASMLWPDLEKYFFDLYGREGEGDSALRSFYYRGLADGKAEALKDLPMWKPAAKAYEGDRLPRIDLALNRLVARFEEGIYYLDIKELSDCSHE